MDRAAQEGPRGALLGGCGARIIARCVKNKFYTHSDVPSHSPQLLAVLGGQFKVGDEICGCVLSVRFQEDILSIWNRSADSRKVCMQIRDTMRNVMGLPLEATMEYKKHTDSMRDNSSYRNASKLQ